MMNGTPILAFNTSNSGKLREAREWLGLPVEEISLELEELQTTDMGALVRHKTESAYLRAGRPLMVEDTSLVFKAWGALPGPFIKYFLAEMGMEGLVRALQPFGDDRGEAVSMVGYHDGETVRLFEGRIEGTIVSPRGQHGFGWDPIFQPQGAAKTLGEMEPGEKRRYSMRALAFQSLAAALIR